VGVRRGGYEAGKLRQIQNSLLLATTDRARRPTNDSPQGTYALAPTDHAAASWAVNTGDPIVVLGSKDDQAEARIEQRLAALTVGLR